MKEDNTPPKEVKEWTEADEAELTKLMSKIVTIEETELAVQRKIAAEEDELKLIAMSKVRDLDKIIAINKADSSSAFTESTSKLTAAVASESTTSGSFDPSEILIHLKFCFHGWNKY